jgi:hypothetical protein
MQDTPSSTALREAAVDSEAEARHERAMEAYYQQFDTPQLVHDLADVFLCPYDTRTLDPLSAKDMRTALELGIRSTDGATRVDWAAFMGDMGVPSFDAWAEGAS